MRKKSIFIFTLLAAIILIISFPIGCSNSEEDVFNPVTPSSSPSASVSPSPSPSPSIDLPSVESIDPADGETDVAANDLITITFSKEMDESTINATNVQVTGSSGNVTGTFSKVGTLTVFKFTPADNLTVLSTYSVKVTTGVKDTGGNQLASEFTSSFTVRERRWGTAELIETDDAGSAVYPYVAVDPSGNAIAVWHQHDGSRYSIWSNRYTVGSGWGTAELIETDNVGHAYYPRVAVDPSGNAVAVWEQGDGIRQSIWSNRYTVGSGWGTAELIETDNNGDAGFPQVAIDPSGNAIAVWYQSDGTLNNIWSNRYTAGSGWGTAELIETDSSGEALYPRIAVDSSGNAIAVWHQFDGTRFNIWSNRYTSGSGWGTAELIETDNNGNAVFAQAAFDDSGNAVAVWHQYDGTRNNIWSNRYTAGSGWGTAELIETDDAGNAMYPEVAVDPSGNAVVVWYQSDGTRSNIWSNRYTAGSGWGTAELIESENAGDAMSPQVGIDDSGNAVAVWYQYDGTLNNIWSNRYTAGSGWGTAELIETDNAGEAKYPEVAVDPYGNAVAVWYQSDGTLYNILSNLFR